MTCLITKTAGVYRPRQPLESNLHHLVRQHWDEFRAVYADRYARKCGHWRPIYDKTVRHFLKCGDLHHGFARVRCPDCRHEFFVAFSCKQRCICPSCSQKRTLLFGMHIADDVCLTVPHRQFVWTIPKRLRIFFRYHRDLLRELPRLAWQSIQTVYHALLGDEAAPGGILAVQTFGQLLHFHPHIHGLVTNGAFTSDGRFLHLPLNLGHEPFLKVWKNSVFSLLLDAGRIDSSVVKQIRSWRHSGFSVDRSVRLGSGDRNGIQRLAEYMARSPFSLARLVKISPNGQVLYRAENHTPRRFPDSASETLAPGPSRNFHIFQPLDFLAELVQHIPNKGEHLIRYYGHYSNKARGMRVRQNMESTDRQPPSPNPQKTETSRLDRRRWAMLIKQIYHADPLLCPKCGGAMKIISFIEARQGNVIRKILQHCGLWDFGEKPAPRPPPVPIQRRFDNMRKSTGKNFPLFQAAGLKTPAEILTEVDPDFLEHLRYEDLPEPEPPWDD